MNTNELKKTRPIYTSLPSVYSEFCDITSVTPSGLLVEFWEKIYLFWDFNLTNFLEFDGDLNKFSENQINAIAPFFGFPPDWILKHWTKEQKIKLYRGVYNPPYIWKNRGSLAVFNYVMDALNIPGNLSRTRGFIAGISKAGDVCGYPANSEYILYIPQGLSSDPVLYDSLEWILHQFIPLHVKVNLVETSDTSLTTRPTI